RGWGATRRSGRDGGGGAASRTRSQPVRIAEANDPVIVASVDRLHPHRRGQTRERLTVKDHRLHPQLSVVGTFEVRMLDDFAGLDEAHRRIETAVISRTG